MAAVEAEADALWRAAVYASVCQLHLRGNVLLAEPLRAEHVKERPSGHWGTVPGTPGRWRTLRLPETGRSSPCWAPAMRAWCNWP
jgi:hypothetical protein